VYLPFLKDIYIIGRSGQAARNRPLGKKRMLFSSAWPHPKAMQSISLLRLSAAG